jgi:hypothetical protein
VPAVAANAGAGTWWQIGVTNLMPQITGANTTVDGTAYSAADGVTVLDTNAGVLGAGGTVGVGAIALGQVARPELEIADATGAGSSTLTHGLYVNANTVTIRDLAIWGFGTGAIDQADIYVGNVANTLIEGNIVGASAGSFTDPGAERTQRHAIHVQNGDTGIIRGNLIGFARYAGVNMQGNTNGWTIERDPGRRRLRQRLRRDQHPQQRQRRHDPLEPRHQQPRPRHRRGEQRRQPRHREQHGDEQRARRRPRAVRH